MEDRLGYAHCDTYRGAVWPRYPASTVAFSAVGVCRFFRHIVHYRLSAYKIKGMGHDLALPVV